MALSLEEITSKMMVGMNRRASDYPVKPIQEYKVLPMVGVKSIMHQCRVRGTVGDYLVLMVFQKIEFSEESKPNTVMVKVEDRVMYASIPTTRSPVQLRCDCDDFRFTWEYALTKIKSMIGQWRRYKRVPGSTRPPKNPNDVPGYCKHIYSFTRTLMSSNVLK